MSDHSALDIQNCIELCRQTRAVCLDAVLHCLQKGGRLAEIQRVRLLLECADTCWKYSRKMLSRSFVDPALEAACTTLCIDSAHACQTGAVDEVLTACAATCWRCANACRPVTR